jgi:Fe-S-cluster-containing dehydrogenase component
MSAIRIRTLGGLSSSYFATHCLGCKGERACVEACPTEALTPREGGGIKFDESRCIGCRKCEDACIAKAIHFAKDYKFPIVCKQCGMCVKFCPHNCLTMEDYDDVK